MSTDDEDEDEELGEQQEIEIDISSNDNEDEDGEFGELGAGTNGRDCESSVEEEKEEEMPANMVVDANDYNYNALRAQAN